MNFNKKPAPKPAPAPASAFNPISMFSSMMSPQKAGSPKGAAASGGGSTAEQMIKMAAPFLGVDPSVANMAAPLLGAIM